MKSRALFISIFITLLLLMGYHGSSAAAQDVSLRLTPEWKEALEPLRSMPVQDSGFIRSGYTFGENHLMAIAGKKKFEGADPFDAIFSAMLHPDVARQLPLLKLGHPDLGKKFGGKAVSLENYRKPGVREMLIELLRSDQEKWTRPVNEIEHKAILLEELEDSFAIVPRDKEWLSPKSAAAQQSQEEMDVRIIAGWNELKAAADAGDAARGSKAAAALRDAVVTAADARDAEIPNLKLDLFYHEHAPFSKAALAYILSAVVYVLAWILNRPKLAWAGYGLLAAGFVEHTIGITARWILSGRAPLSNMFESFVFAIGGMILVALIFEYMARTRIAGVGSAVLGFIFMVLAHKAPIFDSQIRPIMPALQSSWLTYHVVTIMLSYSAFALSFFVSVTYLGKDLLTKGLGTNSPLVARIPSLESMDVFNYRIIAVGFPLLTIGIIFGAVWAATAWGRPWGFDPKETWSAITWLIYAIYLHVRYLANWKGRRAAILAIIGFAAVLFTYLGVNYLLPGLHSYV